MIRLSYVELFDFKNTEYGIIEFPTAGIDPRDLDPGADIIGIYGQNGSGKTSVVDALAILKALLSGAVYARGAVLDAFGPERDRFRLAIGMEHSSDGAIADAIRYEVEFARSGGEVWVSREKLSGRFASPVPRRAKRSVRTVAEVEQASLAAAPELAPKGPWKSLLAASDTIKTNILVGMGLAQREGRSLIVNRGVYRWLCALATQAHRQGVACVEPPEDALPAGFDWEPPASSPRTFQTAFRDVLDPLLFLIPRIGYHFMSNVGIITTLDHVACSLRLAPEGADDRPRGFEEPPMTLPLSEPVELAVSRYGRVCGIVEGISRVMGSLIPGFSIEVQDLGARMSDAGEEVRRVEFLSNRSGVRIPLRCESEGVRKLISLTTALIQVHTRPDAFVAIDELDAGIFEYLLGELLNVIGDFGCGQLVFTAHNLRALETLHVRNIVLTTTNPKRRFIKFKGRRPDSNLRDQYLRAINLGGQDEAVYAATNKYDIDSALFSAMDADEPPVCDAGTEVG